MQTSEELLKRLNKELEAVEEAGKVKFEKILEWQRDIDFHLRMLRRVRQEVKQSRQIEAQL